MNEMQQLLWTINWIRSLLGITNQDLAPLFDLLRGDTALNFPRMFSKEAQEALDKVLWAIELCQAHWLNPNLPLLFAVLVYFHLYGLIFQWDLKIQDPLLILEWVFLSYQQSKTITTCPEIIS